MVNLNTYLLNTPRILKRLLVLSLDVSICIASVWLALYLRLGEAVVLTGNRFFVLVLALCICIPIFVISGLYRMIFRYTGWTVFLTILRAVALYGAIFAPIIIFIGFDWIPRTIGLIQPLLLLVGVVLSRMFIHYWFSEVYKDMIGVKGIPAILIYGAGKTGRQLAKAVSLGGQMRMAGFIDDDPQLQHSYLDGKKIFRVDELDFLVPSLEISVVLLALPAISRFKRNQILKNISKHRVAVKSIPSFSDLASGKLVVSDLKELDIEDLLGRAPVPPDPVLFEKNIRKQNVMVTGAGGSIGRELCKQICVNHPNSLILLEQSEYSLYCIHQELLKIFEENGNVYKSIELIPLLGSVQDQNRMAEIFSRYSPDTIFHAAAYKHVPLVESNPFEAVKNNILGTQILAKIAAEHTVSNFVLISTDKAVRPTNIMGATKRIAELIIQAMAASDYGCSTCYSIVRFGNVLDSSGSVVPRFREQIKSGGPITLTDLNVTRYFMTIPEAAQLVIQAGAMANGGEVFVLDMGEEVKIFELATRMVELSGLSLKTAEYPDGDIEIKVIGLRPGEKLYEELLIGENPELTQHNKILKANEKYVEYNLLSDYLSDINQAITDRSLPSLIQIFKLLDIDYRFPVKALQ